MPRTSRKYLALALLLGAGLLSVLPLFLHANLPRGDDVAEHVQFVQEYTEGLAEGRLYPRWLQHANRGYGAPAFLFYPPLATALVSLIHAAGVPLLPAFKVGLALLSVLAALAAGRLVACSLAPAAAAPAGPLGVRSPAPAAATPAGPLGVRSPAPAAAAATAAGVVGGALFVLLPYHALDVFVRFALAETATFVFLPLFFLYLERPVGGRRAALGGAAFAALCLAHLPTAYVTAWISIAWVGLRAVRGARLQALGSLLAVLLLGGGCATVYWLPALAERGSVHADWLETNPVYRFDAHFLFSPDEVDVSDDPIHGPRGTIPLPTLRRVRHAVLLTAGLALLAWAARRLALARGWLPSGDTLDRYALLAAGALLAMTRLSDPLWRFFPGLASVAFPWRLALFLTLAAAVLTGGALAALPRRWLPAAASLVILGALGASLVSVAGVDWQHFTAGYAQSPAIRQRVAGAFMPRSNPVMRGFGRRPPVGPPRLWPAGSRPGRGAPPALLVSPDRATPHHRRLELEVPPPPVSGEPLAPPQEALLDLATFDYPGWQVTVDGRVARHGRGETGQMTVPLPPGRHTVVWTFRNTPLRLAAAVVSGIFLIFLISLTVSGANLTIGSGSRP